MTAWLVICDGCGRIINAKDEFYIIHDDEDLCQECESQEGSELTPRQRNLIKGLKREVINFFREVNQ
jgi:hypothetical protein